MQCAITWVECLGATTLRTARTLSMASGTCLMTPMLKRPRIVKLSLREPICSSTPAEMLVPLLRQNPRWVLTTGLGECPGFRTSPLQAQKSLRSLAETNQVRFFVVLAVCIYLFTVVLASSLLIDLLPVTWCLSLQVQVLQYVFSNYVCIHLRVQVIFHSLTVCILVNMLYNTLKCNQGVCLVHAYKCVCVCVCVCVWLR